MKSSANQKLKLTPFSRIILKGLKTGKLRKASASLLSFGSALTREKISPKIQSSISSSLNRS